MESPSFNSTENKSFQKWGYAGKSQQTPHAPKLNLHVVRYHQQYKWIWLSRGKLLDVPPIQYTNVTDLRFWDERIGGVVVAAGYNKGK